MGLPGEAAPSSRPARPSAWSLTEGAAIDSIQRVLQPWNLSRLGAAWIWTALKSRPNLLFTIPRGQFPPSLPATVSRAILGEGGERQAVFMGHPWWVKDSRRAAFYARVQQQFTRAQFSLFAEQAAACGDAARIHFACVQRISRAELARLALHDHHGQPNPAAAALFSDPDRSRPSPPCLSVLASIELEQPWADETQAIGSWTLVYASLFVNPGQQDDPRQAAVSLPSDALLARQRYFQPRLDLFNQHPALWEPIHHLVKALKRRGAHPSWALLRDGMLHLGNAWDAQGVGLFSADPSENIALAAACWYAHAALPRLLAAGVMDRLLAEQLALELASAVPSWLVGRILSLIYGRWP